jgi:O-antigen/teichoic acid export membrane protein
MKKETHYSEEKVKNSLTILAKSSLIVLFGLFISKVLAYVYRIIIARQFGAEEYGLFSLATVIFSFFVAVFSLGLSDGLLRYLAVYRGESNKNKTAYLFKWVFKIMAISGLLGSVILFFFSQYISINIFHNSGLVFYLRIFSILTLVSILCSPFLSLLRSYEKIASYSFYLNIVQNIAKVLGLLILIFIGFESKSIALSSLLAFIIILFGLYFSSKSQVKEVFEKPIITLDESMKIKKEVFNYSLPLMFFGVLSIMFYWVDTFSVGYLKTAVEVGIYNAAVPIAMLLFIVPELFMQLFFPLISKEYARKNKKLIEQLSKQVTKWILVLNLPIFVLLFLFPGAALNILFGPEFIIAQTSLRILLVSALLTTMFTVSQQLLSMTGKSKTILTSMIFAVILNLILNQILIPMKTIGFIDNASGVNGAAIATLIANILFLSIIFIQAYKSTSIIPLRRKVVNVFISIVISLIPLLILRNFLGRTLFALSLMCVTFLLFYLILLFATKSLDKYDIEILKKLKAKLSNIKILASSTFINTLRR